MAYSIAERIKRAWAVLGPIKEGALDGPFNYDPGDTRGSIAFGGGSAHTVRRTSKDILLAPILNRIAVDVASIPIRHVDLDEKGAFLNIRSSELNQRLSDRANLDQTGGVLIQEAVEVLLSTGTCVLVPVVTTMTPTLTSSYEILSLRVGRVSDWHNRTVTVAVYNEDTGNIENITLSKEFVAIVYNPFFNIMNQQNSTLQRLIEKLAQLDKMDSKAVSNQLDLILQLPFQVRTDKRRKAAQQRLAELEEQLANSKYGIGYIDATEKVTPLNRPVKYTLTEQITYLYDSLHSQLGLTPAVFSGTASELEILVYHNRTVYPILTAITEAMRTTFLTKTARTQGQSIVAYQKLFKLSPLSELAEAVDKFTRNEIMSSNEIRAELGLPQSEQEEADELRNKNLSKPKEDEGPSPKVEESEEV